MRKAVQWFGALLGALMYTALIILIFRPSLPWAIGIALIFVPGFACAFFWAWVERPAELRKKLGYSKEDCRAMSDETTPHSHWPPR